MTLVSKPWGNELTWAKTDHYVGKILHINKGHAPALRYHRVKEKTIMVLLGEMELIYYTQGQEPQSMILWSDQPFHIPPGMRHRMFALTDVDVLEVSTPELDDVVWIEFEDHPYDPA